MAFKATVKNYEITVVPKIKPDPTKVQIRYEGAASGRMEGLPIASIQWGTEIEFAVTPGMRTADHAPEGSLTGRLVWAEALWTSAVGQSPICTGPRVNELLIDKFAPV